MPTQADKARAFRALHERRTAFIIPNPWDAGTARLLAHLGFEALATTSAGYAFSAGKPDHGVSRDAMLEHVASIAAAVDLPVSGDLENGYGDSPEDAAQTILLAAAAGLVGGSIEDSTNGSGDQSTKSARPLSASPRQRKRRTHSRFRSRLQPVQKTICTASTISTTPFSRLQAFQKAGADVLYAPASLAKKTSKLSSAPSIARNVLAGLGNAPLDFSTLSALGVKRISVGGALSRAAIGGFLRAAHEMHDNGVFTFTSQAANSSELNEIFASFESLN